MTEGHAHIILFDGVCNLCNGFVRFLIRRDPQNRFRFASLQSVTGRRLLREHGFPEHPLNSVVYIKDGRSYQTSEAVLEILKTLGGAWSILGLFRLVPRGIRDGMYRFIARRRYRWFGKKEACMIPTPQLQHRFLS